MKFTWAFFVITAVGYLAVLMWNLSASVLAELAGVNYNWIGVVGSLSIYVYLGYLIASRSGWRAAPVCGGIIGLIESLVSWSMVWRDGPGSPDWEPDYILIIFAILAQAGFGGAVALIGGLARRLRTR